eukprot:CAMPEP_0170547268 /NCGR_PEP_ID=MMETSP0211-20121228/5628_1 /TAXON_ID=311385 /ORGANISM="Pseudokeronopsis sp., Strain OXSARD2" /LENGTH=89 /DNA_ID=CAMNT_0010852175 /DNA_START=277 /DNA_END=543 /DNA_ORIENTATION=-
MIQKYKERELKRQQMEARKKIQQIREKRSLDNPKNCDCKPTQDISRNSPMDTNRNRFEQPSRFQSSFKIQEYSDRHTNADILDNYKNVV